MMLTGGEKYNVKCIIIKINEMYPKIKEVTSKNYANNSSLLTTLYNYTLDIFISLSNLTTNIISSDNTISEIFDLLQEVHYYKAVNSQNKETLITVINRIPELQSSLIDMVESDTSNRDAVLRQIMDELGIVDPNAKKKKSLW